MNKDIAVDDSSIHKTTKNETHDTTKEDEEYKTNKFEAGDHITRWSHFAYMYPIQIHGIVLEKYYDQSIKIVDFGYTKQIDTTKQEEEYIKKERIIIPSDSNRLNIRILKNQKDINKWSKVNYGERLKNTNNHFDITKWFTSDAKNEPIKEKLFDLSKYDVIDEFKKDWNFPIKSDVYKEPDFICFNQNHVLFHEQHIMDDGQEKNCDEGEKNSNEDLANSKISFVSNNDEMLLSSSMIAKDTENDEITHIKTTFNIENNTMPSIHTTNETKLDVFPSKKKFSLFPNNTSSKRKQKVVDLSPAAFISFPIKIENEKDKHNVPDFVTNAFSSFDMNDDIVRSPPTSNLMTDEDSKVQSSACSASNEANEQTPQPPQTLPKSDPVKLVLARVRFLLSHEKEALPAYHVFTSNSECIAVWCKTGRWSTLQASIFLHSTAVGNAKQTVLAIGSVAAINPLLIPAIAPLGLVYIGAPVLYWYKCRDTWEKITNSLNDHFWSVADNDVFVAVIQEWTFGIKTGKKTMKRVISV